MNKNGTITDLGQHAIFGNVTIDGTKYAGWTLGSKLDLSVFGTGGPNFGVLNAVQSSGFNGSISGNNPHNPFSRGTATFVMSVAGVTAATDVTGGDFQFGTNQNGGFVVTVPDKLTPVPEPTSLAMMSGLGLIGLAYRTVRRRAPAPI